MVVLERLRNLEGLVRELSGQLEQTNASSGSVDGGLRAASTANSPGSASGTSGSRDAHQGLSGVSSPSVRHAGVQNQSGRMVRKDADRSRYVSSGFWTRVDVSCLGLVAISRCFPSCWLCLYSTSVLLLLRTFTDCEKTG